MSEGSVVDLLEKAADVFRKRGGARCMLDDEMRVCLVGAVAVAAGFGSRDLQMTGTALGYRDELQPALTALRDVAVELFPRVAEHLERPVYVYVVNDDEGPEASQRLLDETVKRLKGL